MFGAWSELETDSLEEFLLCDLSPVGRRRKEPVAKFEFYRQYLISSGRLSVFQDALYAIGSHGVTET